MTPRELWLEYFREGVRMYEAIVKSPCAFKSDADMLAHYRRMVAKLETN